MADSSSEEKTEKPSAQKLRKAREEGQLPRSKDMGLAASLFAAFVVISSSFPWYADFVRESFISVHQYAQEINNPQVIGQFLRHHLLILGKFILTLLPMPAAALLFFAGAGRLAVSAEKNPPGFQQNQPVKRHWATVFQRTSGGNGEDDSEVGGGAGNAVGKPAQ